ncbi:glycosyltransferase family 4 protein [uncultured Amnibacterium sp.]|uniref:glycosyltransferase family 4 protein n=1 Tax=uncultured Amnibacterium sp. TaxID=1631851 RepID=UPI0035C9CFB5
MIAAPPTTRLALASRGDALTPYLSAALERRYGSVERIDPELTALQRYGVAALTMRPSRSAWAERFYKSGTGTRLRSANAVRQLLELPASPDVVLQVHALFTQPVTASALYIDCTHRQSAESWPAWNPLRGRGLDDWYRREQASYDAAQHLFAFCEPTRRSLVEDYAIDPAKVTVVGAGANLPELPASRPQPPAGLPTILLIGNDFVRKGGQVLLEAFRLVRRRLPAARLVLVGTRPPIAAQAGVEVLGRVRDRARIAGLYREASVLCVPSFFDPFPLVVLEAMAFGVPVVTTEQAGTPEMITDGRTGLLVPTGDVPRLAEALLDLLLDPERAARLAEAARRDVEERFTWDRVVERMAPALESMAPDRSR